MLKDDNFDISQQCIALRIHLRHSLSSGVRGVELLLEVSAIDIKLIVTKSFGGLRLFFFLTLFLLLFGLSFLFGRELGHNGSNLYVLLRFLLLLDNSEVVLVTTKFSSRSVLA